MIRLSRRAWNNVLIFSVLIMIVLFNSTNNFLTDGTPASPEQIPLLPPDSVVMTIDFGSTEIERVGRGWRSVPPANLTEPQLANTVEAWTLAEVELYQGSLGGSPRVVVVWLAGETNGRVFELYDVGQQLVLRHQKQLFRVVNFSASQLIPVEVQ